MGFLDKAKAKAAAAVDKHGDKIDQGLDKAGEMADKKTHGQHSDKIADARGKATDALGKLDGTNDDTPPSTSTPSTSTDSTSTDSGTPPPVR
jgi:hypothetical protein